ncbi:VWA domain-containing protein [Candidatus Woesearchaeota archaeon]|nr:VWA domain-containing protein [Candidatus Woesearchaeota archaeon]
MEVVFEAPSYLFFLLSLPLLIMVHYITLRYAKGRVLQFANFVAMSRVANPNIRPRNTIQLFIRLIVLACIVLAVSGMKVTYLGPGSLSDYVLAIDISSSMSSTDIAPSRLEAAKSAALDFVDSSLPRTSIGLVSFAGTAFVEEKLTDNKEAIKNKITGLGISSVGGTDIGEAIVSASNVLITSINPKTVILITDGRSNIGVGTARAIEYANENTIQVFTIGIGTEEGGSPLGINVSLRLDEDVLRTVAEMTEGQYVKAESSEAIKKAYSSIIESTERKYTTNMTIPFLFLIFVGSVIDWVLMNTKYRRIP